MLEMLLVGLIVIVAATYSTWFLLPGPARQKIAARLLPFAASAACPAWLGRRLRSAADGTGGAKGACDACSASRDPDGGTR